MPKMIYDVVLEEGMQIGELTIVKQDGERRYGTQNAHEPLWLCKCSCGKEVHRPQATLRKSWLNNSDSNCQGIAHKKYYSKKLQKVMKREFSSLNYLQSNYKVVSRWNSSTKGCLDNFIEDMGVMPEGTTCCYRVNKREPFGPGNCKWGTRSDVGRIRSAHNKRSKFTVVYNSVFYQSEYDRYIAKYKEEDGKRKAKYFSLHKYGSLSKAKAAAIDFRKEYEQKIMRGA